MSQRIVSLAFAVSIALPACVGLVSEKDRPCPCAPGWTCCAGDGPGGVCVGPGGSCPADADGGQATVSGVDGGPPETTGGDDGATGGTATMVGCGTETRSGGPVLLATLPAAGATIAVDGADLYVAPYEVGVVTRVSLSDCSTTAFNPVAANTVATSATQVYSVNGLGGNEPSGLVTACPKTGCAGTYQTIASGQSMVWGLAVDDTSVYWTNQGSSGAVMKAPLGGGPATTLVSAISANVIAVAAGQVFFLGARSGSGSAMLWSVPVTGGTPSVLFGTPVDDAGVVVASAGGSVSGLAVDAVNVYFATTNGVIGQIPIAGGSVTTLATGQGDQIIFGIAVDSTDVYWATEAGSIYRTPIGAGRPVTLLATMQDYIEGLAVDETNVYFTTAAGGVYMLRK